MPIYEYRCRECEQIFEEWQKSYTDEEMPCPVCGGDSKRLISNTAFVLKGTGWYVTDYKNGAGSSSASSSSSGSNGNGGGNGKSNGEAKSADSGSSTESSSSSTSTSSSSAGSSSSASSSGAAD